MLGFKKSNKKETSTKKKFQQRYFVVLIIFFPIVVFGLIFQLYRWQVTKHEHFSILARSQVIEDKRLPTSRGTIYASDGTVLAVDEPVWGIYASVSGDESERQRFNEQREEFIDAMVEILNVDREELNQKLTEDFRYVPIKRQVSAEKKKQLEEKNLFGVFFQKEEKRIYPNGSLASHILGFVGKNSEGKDVGQYGLEGYYAGDLLGQEGFRYEEKDSRGNVIMTGEYDPVLPRQGKNIVLTIVPTIQSRVEEELKKGVKKYEAKSGSAIIMDPSTGEILAMANYPTYDPNYYWKEDDAYVFKNKAVSDVYEYGSVHKVLTVAAALQEGEITPSSICQDHEGSLEVLDKTIYTWDHMPDGDLIPADVLKYSNNVCAVKIGLSIGIDKNYDYIRDFGIGDFVGIGLQDEATSYLKPLGYWNEVDLASASFGQMISATPLQIVSAVSTIANDGKRMRPHVVKKLYDDEEEIVIEPEAISEPLSEDVAYEVQDMMETVVEEGEAWKFFDKYLPGYEVAGKTGTAQVPLEDEVGYYEDRTNTTFVGFAPVHEAKMIMIVRLEEPQTNEFAASTAVPLWIEIFKNVSMELGIAPEAPTR
jgi:cell division protein FtsI/penicillin-binding protein 2